MHSENDAVALHLALQALAADYRAHLPGLACRIAELEAAAASGDRSALDALREELHRAAGNAGTVGFPAVSTAARHALSLIDRGAAPTQLRPAVVAALSAMREAC